MGNKCCNTPCYDCDISCQGDGQTAKPVGSIYTQHVTDTAETYPTDLETKDADNLLSHKIMFLKELLMANRVDVNHPEILEMQECLRERLGNAIEPLKGSKLEIADIILCGSMAEGTRVFEYESISEEAGVIRVPAVEFDFLAVLNTTNSRNEDTIQVVKSRKCKHKTISRLQSYDGSPPLRYHLPTPSRLRYDIRQKVSSYLSHNVGPSRLTVMPDVYQSYSNIKYRFLWKPCGLRPDPTNVPSTEHVRNDMCVINVDIMPAICYGRTVNDNQLYLIPKPMCDYQDCFMTSYCRDEIQTLQETSQEHRDVFMLLKVFNNQLPRLYKTPTYFLKTAVLHHLQRCERPDLIGCFREMLRFLSESYKRGKLLTIGNNINLLAGDRLKYDVVYEGQFIFNTFHDFLDHVESTLVEYKFNEYLQEFRECTKQLIYELEERNKRERTV